MSSAALSNAQLNVHRTPVQVSEVVKQSGAVEKVNYYPKSSVVEESLQLRLHNPSSSTSLGTSGNVISVGQVIPARVPPIFHFIRDPGHLAHSSRVSGARSWTSVTELMQINQA